MGSSTGLEGDFIIACLVYELQGIPLANSVPDELNWKNFPILLVQTIYKLIFINW